MSVWAMVPIKPLNRAKSRLASVLRPEQREHLALGMLIHNLEVLTKASGIAGVLVISRDTKALAAARMVSGVQTLHESGTPELNSALQRASRMLLAWGASATLILPADVPLVRAEDIETMVDLGSYTSTLVIAPDRRRDGTNAIFTRPPDLIDYGFGAGSFQKHIYAAQLVGAKVHIYESEYVCVDVDSPDDLEYYHEQATRLGLPIIDYMGEALPTAKEES